MNKIAILPLPGENGKPLFRATTGNRHSHGNTAGEALDALTAQMPPGRSSTLVILQSFQPDEFFTAAQQQRLSELMDLSRAARNSGNSLPPSEQKELEELIEAELIASANRTDAMATELKK